VPPRTRSRIIQLGAPQFAVVLAGLFTAATIFWALQPFHWEDLYYRDVVLPRMQKSHGFGWGPVTFHCRGETAPTFQGITSVLPGGRFSQLGFRPADVPFTRHGGGYGVLHAAVEAADQNHFADVDVVNAQDCFERKQDFRTVALHPQIRETPVFLVAGTLLPSPTGSQAIEVTFPEREEAPHGVWLIDLPAGRSRTLWNYRDRARATWSDDGRWLAVTDDPIMTSSRCLLLEVNRQAIVDPLEKLSSLPRAMRPSDVDKQLECEIVGWVRHEPTRVALTVFDFFPARGEHWRFDYYFDVAAGRLIAAGSR
jgi:hypothetical protein